MKLVIILVFLMLMMTETFSAQTVPPALEPGVSQALAKWRAAHYGDVRYKLNITLEKGAPLMRGTIEISVKLTEEGAKSPLMLDWRTTAFANDKDKPSADVLEVNGTVIKDVVPSGNYDYAVNKEHLYISERHLKTGENVVKIQFASPIKTSGAAITRYVDKEDGAEYIYSLFVPSDASTAFPVFDQPDLKARFQLSLRPPQDWKVVSNTPSSRRRIDPMDTGVYVFEETKPISTYVFAFAAGEFWEFPDAPDKNRLVKQAPAGSGKIYEPLPDPNRAKIYVRKSQAEKFAPHQKEVFRLNREAVKYLESYFDYKFPFPKYDLVLIPEFPFGGMEHAGATFLREASIIFPSEPTKNDYISRANLIFHEAAHQWFGDTVTMKWFDDLWLKEGFAEFMAYKTLEKVMPEYNAWKAFYERNKPLAYLTDSTKGTTPIYQEIRNLSAAKSAYGNIVYRKAPSFLRQAEFYLGEKEFQTAARAFLKKHEYANAEWTDLVSEFETASKQNLKEWSKVWVTKRGMPLITTEQFDQQSVSVTNDGFKDEYLKGVFFRQKDILNEKGIWLMKTNVLLIHKDGKREVKSLKFDSKYPSGVGVETNVKTLLFAFPNYQDYGYGTFLLDQKSRDYVLKSIQTEKDDFLRSMMWGTLWDSVREAELDPKQYVELAIKNIAVEQDESTINAILSRVGTALNYYIASPAGLQISDSKLQADPKSKIQNPKSNDLVARLEAVLTERIANAKTPGQRITFYRAYQNLASSAAARQNLKDILAGRSKLAVFQLRTKDKFDIVTRLLILGDKDAPALLANLEKTEPGDDAKRYAYAARAGIATGDSKAKYFKDFMTDKNLSESWIEAAFVPFNSSRHADLTLPFLETALAELPNLKRTRKIFFVNGWLGAFIGGQKSEAALQTVNKFLADNPNLDRDLRLKILENMDNLERAVKIRAKFSAQ
jgi:aminopeptidase N